MEYLFEGNISVKAALLSPYRNITKIIVDIDKKDKDTKFILRKADELNILIETKIRGDIDILTRGKTHGGLVAYVGERNYQTFKELSELNFIAVVEGIEDPFNFAYILRNLYATGCNAIITNERNWSNAASTLAKASAGASEYIPHIISEDFTSTLQYLKEKGIQIVCANRNDQAIEMYDYNFKQPICICIGGEKRGLSKAITNASDQDVYIPYNTDFKNALSAASATSILAFEIVRQRRQK